MRGLSSGSLASMAGRCTEQHACRKRRGLDMQWATAGVPGVLQRLLKPVTHMQLALSSVSTKCTDHMQRCQAILGAGRKRVEARTLQGFISLLITILSHTKWPPDRM